MSNTHTFRFPLGVKARCIITGFEGIITSRREELSGCDSYTLTAKFIPGQKLESFWIHEGEIEITDANPITQKPAGPGAG